METQSLKGTGKSGLQRKDHQGLYPVSPKRKSNKTLVTFNISQNEGHSQTYAQYLQVEYHPAYGLRR